MPTWNLVIQSMVLQVVSSKYHAHLKYFKITDGVVFGIKKIVKLYFSNMYLILQSHPYFLVILI